MSLTAEQIEKSNIEFNAWFSEDMRDIDLLCANFDKAALAIKSFYRKGWLARQETLCFEVPYFRDDQEWPTNNN